MFTNLLTDLANAVTSVLKIVLPGAAEAIVDFGNKLMFTGQGESAQMNAVFGFLIVGGIIGASTGIVKSISKRLT